MKFFLSVLHRAADGGNTVRRVGEFAQLEEAVAAARQLVNASLKRAYADGMTASQLLAQYQTLGEAPYIVRDDEATINAGSFNHFKYAKACSEKICAGTNRRVRKQGGKD